MATWMLPLLVLASLTAATDAFSIGVRPRTAIMRANVYAVDSESTPAVSGEPAASVDAAAAPAPAEPTPAV